MLHKKVLPIIKVLKIVHKKVHSPQKSLLRETDKRLKKFQEKSAKKGLKLVQKKFGHF